MVAAALAMIFASSLTSAVQAQINQIYNPGFEMGPTSPVRPNGNLFVQPNTDNAVGWLGDGGPMPNIVQVDGPGVFNYGTAGPQNDATGTATSLVPRRYLDIRDGTNSVYQRFTPQCTGDVTFGAWFSTRDNSPGSGRIRILEGSTLQGSVISDSNVVSLPGGNSTVDPWVQSQGAVNLVAGTTYVFQILMNNNLNMDEAYVYFAECAQYPNLPDVSNPQWPPLVANPTAPTAVAIDPCCPPWTSKKLGDALIYKSAGSIGSNYTLEFDPAHTLNGHVSDIPGLQIYLNYVKTQVTTVTGMVLQVRLHDQGTNEWPASHPNAIGQGYYNAGNGSPVGPISGLIFTPNATTVAKHINYTPTPNIFMGASVPSATPTSYPMQVGRWYAIRSSMWLDGGRFFEDKCAMRIFYVRVQAMTRSSGGGGPVTLQVLEHGSSNLVTRSVR
jgi:hypothetical protein